MSGARSRLPLVCVALACAAGVLQGCSRASDESGADRPPAAASASGTAKPDPCSLLTPDDIQEVLQTEASAPERQMDGLQCTWPATASPGTPLVSVLVTGSAYQSYDQFAEQYARELNADPKTAVHQLEAAGKFALGFRDMPMVQIHTGSTMVQVAAYEHEEKHALELATRAVKRLPR